MSIAHTSRTDFDGNSASDLLWNNGPYGGWAHWDMDSSGRMVINAALIQTPPNHGWHFAGLGDTNGNGVTDLIWQNSTGEVSVWSSSDGRTYTPTDLTVYAQAAPVVATGDFNGDGLDDILFHTPPTPGSNFPDGLWMVGDASNRLVPSAGMGALDQISPDWQFQGVGDFNGDGKDDVLFHGTGNATAGQYLLEILNTSQPAPDRDVQTQQLTFKDPLGGWNIAGLGDFDKDGKTDILWRHDGGTIGVWLMDGNHAKTMAVVANPGTAWTPIDVQDYSHDGKADILWQHENGTVGEWTMNGTHLVEAHLTAAPNGWNVFGF